MLNFFDLVSFLGGVFLTFGLGLFGVAAGWFSLFAFNQPERRWELQIAVFLGYFLFTALIVDFASAGAAGAFLLGTASALLYWGNKKEGKSEEAAETKDD